jgi:hypothetical protein
MHVAVRDMRGRVPNPTGRGTLRRSIGAEGVEVRTKSLLGAACCGLVMVVGGCAGGSDRLSAPEYAREVSDVCRRGNRAVAHIEIPSLTSEHDASRAMARVVVVQRDTIDELRDVRPPDSLAASVQKWIALLDQGADELELMSIRLRAGRTPEAVEYGAKATTLLDRARELIAPLHVTSCRGPVLPTV